MRLNYQNLSNCRHNTAFSCYQQLCDYLNTHKVEIYLFGYSYVETFINTYRTNYKKVSFFINSRVIYTTGEVFTLRDNECCNSFLITNEDGRGSVVPIHLIGKGPIHLIGKGPKHFTSPKIGQVRSYVTRSGTNNMAPVQGQQLEIPEELQVIAKHLFIIYQDIERIFYDLRGILKQNYL